MSQDVDVSQFERLVPGVCTLTVVSAALTLVPVFAGAAGANPLMARGLSELNMDVFRVDLTAMLAVAAVADAVLEAGQAVVMRHNAVT